METGSLSNRLIQAAACSRRFLERNSRLRVTDFILSRQNPDGGFRGRATKSDLYYTVFAVASLKALNHPIPALKVWKYARSFGFGEGLDLVHFVSLVRLRIAFPMFKRTRRKLFRVLEGHAAESSYDLFVKLLAEDYLAEANFPTEQLEVPLSGPTTNIASAVLVNRKKDKAAEEALLGRFVESGGFAPTSGVDEPDLLSTATALFALVGIGAKLDSIQQPCFKYVESLWRDSGGFAGHVADGFEDVEYTFYALLSIGCLIQSMARDYGR